MRANWSIPLLCVFFVLGPPRAAIAASEVGGLRRSAHPFDNESWTAKPEFDGIRARAPIPLRLMEPNEGGSDGAGLCVIRSLWYILYYNGRSDIADYMWSLAKREPGGYHPMKLRSLIGRVQQQYPEFRYDEVTERDQLKSFLMRNNEEGSALGITYGTGRAYDMRPIAHMITLIHFDDRWACLVDNNPLYRVEGSEKPGFAYIWIPAEECIRRCNMMGGPWAVAILEPGPPTMPIDWAGQDGFQIAIGGGILIVWMLFVLRLRSNANAQGS